MSSTSNTSTTTDSDFPELCPDGNHDLDDFFNVGGGVVYIGCTKCAYWEPAPESDVEVMITYD